MMSEQCSDDQKVKPSGLRGFWSRAFFYRSGADPSFARSIWQSSPPGLVAAPLFVPKPGGLHSKKTYGIFMPFE